MTLALLDDYPHSNLGHHPDLAVGLAEASARLAGPGQCARLYCPPSFVTGRPLPAGIIHRPFRQVSGDVVRQRDGLAVICRDAVANGVDVLVNLFLDENHGAFPGPIDRPKLVQVLHRPAELAVRRPADDDEMTAFLRQIAPSDLFVVHTRAAHERARRWLPPARLIRLGWPATSAADLAARFAAARPAADREPHALLIGDARDAKGIHELLTALAGGGPLLRIVGQQLSGVQESLTHRYLTTRVDWETGWVSQRRLSDAISAASVVVFPYLRSFGQHGGVSGALAQALTFAKPVVASTVLADQLPPSGACLLVEPGDIAGLRGAIERAIRDTVPLHEVAKGSFGEVLAEHTYDLHVAKIVARAAELPRHRG